MDDRLRDTHKFWNDAAGDWQIQVGDEGDSNRILNSDPVLWDFVGDVRGRVVLDAGCGTGYLSNKLHDRGALVTGVDFSEEMIALARQHYPRIEFQREDCCSLTSLSQAHFDLIVSNYVLMDLPNLPAAVTAFHRVLKPGGMAVLVFSHPCFPQGSAHASDGEVINYRWESSYFMPQRRTDPPWGHFQADFIWFHRPLSDYWKVFLASGFRVADFEEPRITEDRYELAKTAKQLRDCQRRPYSVAFKLEKPLSS